MTPYGYGKTALEVTMTAQLLKSGDCLFYKDKPVRLLYRQRPNVWNVEVIFLDPQPAFDMEFNPHDTVTLLHGTRNQ